MKIITQIDQYSIDKIVSENKRRTEKQIFPTGAVLVPVMFTDIVTVRDNYFFKVENGTLIVAANDKRIDFGFKLYGRSDGPDAVAEMISGFNSFIDGIRENRMSIDDSIFHCVDKILFELGYAGKMVLAEGVETDSRGQVSIFSINYAETLITKEDHEYFEYQYAYHDGNVTR